MLKNDYALIFCSRGCVLVSVAPHPQDTDQSAAGLNYHFNGAEGMESYFCCPTSLNTVFRRKETITQLRGRP